MTGNKILIENTALWFVSEEHMSQKINGIAKIMNKTTAFLNPLNPYTMN